MKKKDNFLGNALVAMLAICMTACTEQVDTSDRYVFRDNTVCNNLLAGHRSPEAYRQVEQFLQENQDMQPLLRNKILSAEHFLKQNNMNINEKIQ